MKGVFRATWQKLKGATRSTPKEMKTERQYSDPVKPRRRRKMKQKRHMTFNARIGFYRKAVAKRDGIDRWSSRSESERDGCRQEVVSLARGLR